MSPRTQRLLNIQYLHWTDLKVGGHVQVRTADCLDHEGRFWTGLYFLLSQPLCRQ
jgi:hypothetical protein